MDGRSRPRARSHLSFQSRGNLRSHLPCRLRVRVRHCLTDARVEFFEQQCVLPHLRLIEPSVFLVIRAAKIKHGLHDAIDIVRTYPPGRQLKRRRLRRVESQSRDFVM